MTTQTDNENIQHLPPASLQDQQPEVLSPQEENGLLLGMACRRAALKEDTDEAWQQFRLQHLSPSSQPQQNNRRFTLHHIIYTALSTAAAVLAAVFVIHSVWNKDEGLVVLSYSDQPSRITLTNEVGDTVDDYTEMDSVSFCQPSLNHHQQQAVASIPVIPGSQIKRLSTPRGMDFKVILSDGTEVWLNAESSIEFPSAFGNKGERLVKLMGEAYFKVAHNPERPFTVVTDQMRVRALGTEFNLRSYAEMPANVALVKGKVEVMRPDATEADVTLSPNECAYYEANGQIKTEAVDTYAVTQWVSGFFYFESEPLVDVLRDLGRWYNLGVIFRNEQAMNSRIHFSALRNESIQSAIESLNRLGRITAKIENNNIVIY